MDRQPTLETERLVLRPLAEADREALHRDLGASIDRLERARLRTAATVLETEGEVAEMKLREKALAEAAAIERVRWEGGAKRGEYGVFITMGPGAGVECALWRF